MSFDDDTPPHKRSRVEANDPESDDFDEHNNTLSLVSDDPLLPSSLPCPTLKLTGHSGSVYALAYSPSGDVLVTASFDRTVLLWDSSYANINQLNTHKNAVLDVCWLDQTHIVTAGADKTLQLHDVHTGQRIRKWAHDKIVNACSTIAPTTATSNTSTIIASACDDGACRLWDTRQRNSITALDSSSAQSSLPVTAVALSDAAVYTGGLDNLIVCWDWKMSQKKLYALKGHTDTITGLAVHPDQTHLLSNSMDQTLQSWDIRPFVASTTAGNDAGSNNNIQQQPKRHVQTFRGHKHAAEKGLLKCSWSADGSMVSCGSADRMVHIWDVYSGEELYLLPGHQGCVNAVAFHPKLKNVVASGSSDHNVLVGELS